MTKVWISEGIEIYPATEITVVDHPGDLNWEWDIPDMLAKQLTTAQAAYGKAERAILSYVKAHPECGNAVLKKYRQEQEDKYAEERAVAILSDRRTTRLLVIFIVAFVVVAIVYTVITELT